MPSPPPPVLAVARVLAYALVDDSAVFTGAETLVVAGEALGAVPRLAICEDLATSATLLLRCDAEWDVLGKGHHASREEAEAEAERCYAGIGERWREAPATRDEALAYYRVEHAEEFCSFCDRWPWQIESWVSTRDGVMICKDCVQRLHGQIHAEDD